jgi:hypothetical protein
MEPVRLDGERWLSATLSIAPRQLPAFSVTWFDVRATGPLPIWVLVLGAMGLHVYGEGSVLVVQDRWSVAGTKHDEFRLAALARWIVHDTLTAPRLTQSMAFDEGGSAAEGALALVRRLWPQGEGFVSEIRAMVAAGHWDLPARKGPPGNARYASGDPGGTRSGLPWRWLAVALSSMAGGVLLLAYLDLPEPLKTLTVLVFSFGLCILPPTAVKIGEHYVERWRTRRARARERQRNAVVVPEGEEVEQEPRKLESSTYRSSPPKHDSSTFMLLHEAMKLEGLARIESAGDLSGLQRYEAHMDEVLRRYRQLTDAPAHAEASALDTAHTRPRV